MAFIVATACALSEVHVASAAPLNFPLRVVGRGMVDANGSRVLLHGVAIGGLVRGSGNSRTICGYIWKAPKPEWPAKIAAAGFNSVRLGVSWANLEPTAPTVNPDGTLTHDWNWTYIAAIDNAVAALGAAGLAVVLDMHQSQWSPAFTHFNPTPNRTVCQGAGMPVWLYPGVAWGDPAAIGKCEFFENITRPGVPLSPQDGFIEAWKFLAARYASMPHVVGADLLSEPGWTPRTCDAPPVLDDFFFRVGSAVQTVAPKMMLIYENGSWPTFIQLGSMLTHKLFLKNAVYSMHLYPPDWNTTVIGVHNPGTGMQYLAENAAIASDYRQPFFVGELNAFNQGYDEVGRHTDPNWDADTRAAMAYMRRERISWSFFAWEPGSGSALLDRATDQPKPDILAALQKGF